MIILVDLDILISQVFTPLHPGHGAGGGVGGGGVFTIGDNY